MVYEKFTFDSVDESKNELLTLINLNYWFVLYNFFWQQKIFVSSTKLQPEISIE